MKKEKRFLKTKGEISVGYVMQFKKWLLLHQEDYFNNKDNKAKHWRDFCHFNSTTDREHLVMKDEIMLIDREINGVHCYVICRIYGNVESSTARVKHIAKVINIDDLERNFWRNGYFLVPVLTKELTQ